MKKLRMCDLREGERGRITAVYAGGENRRRLLDLGAACGAEVCCLHERRPGGMKAFSIGGAVIALRSQDAGTVEIELLKGLKEGAL